MVIEARAALKGLLTNTDVVLPVEGMIVEKQEKRASRTRRTATNERANPVEALPQGIGQGVPFDYTHVEQLWRVVTFWMSLSKTTSNATLSDNTLSKRHTGYEVNMKRCLVIFSVTW